jgi:hypothetical protein
MPHNEWLSIVIHFPHLRSFAHSSLRIPWDERLQICLLALAHRHPHHTVDLDGGVLGPQSKSATGWTALDLIDQLHQTRPDLLEAQARLILDGQQCAIYLLDGSLQRPAFQIHCRGRVPSATDAFVIVAY